MKQRWLVTRGAGFIGGNFVLEVVVAEQVRVADLDALAYVGDLGNLGSLVGRPGHAFVYENIGERTLTAHLLPEHRPDAVVGFAIESHGDAPVDGSATSVWTDVVGQALGGAIGTRLR